MILFGRLFFTLPIIGENKTSVSIHSNFNIAQLIYCPPKKKWINSLAIKVIWDQLCEFILLQTPTFSNLLLLIYQTLWSVVTMSTKSWHYQVSCLWNRFSAFSIELGFNFTAMNWLYITLSMFCYLIHACIITYIVSLNDHHQHTYTYVQRVTCIVYWT